MEHLELMHNAKAAIENVFSDTGVSPDTTRESLEELSLQIEEYLENLANDAEGE